MGSSIRVARFVSCLVGFIIVRVIFLILAAFVVVLLGFMISVVFSVMFCLASCSRVCASPRCSAGSSRYWQSWASLGFLHAFAFTCSWLRAFPRWRWGGDAVLRRGWLRRAELRCMFEFSSLSRAHVFLFVVDQI